MDDFELEIKKEFLNEALMNLEEVESSFMELEGNSDPKALLDKIFRLAHNLKGGSRAVGFGEVAEFTHQLESLVLKVQRGEIPLSSSLVTVLLKSNDRLVHMISTLKNDLNATFDNKEMLEMLIGWLNGTLSADSAAPTIEAEAQAEMETTSEPSVEIAVVAEALVEESDMSIAAMPYDGPRVPDANSFSELETEVSQVAPAVAEKVEVASVQAIPSVSELVPADAAGAGRGPKNGEGKEDEIIRVSLSRIDLLNDFVGELIVLQSVVHQQTVSGETIKLEHSIRQLMKLSKDIQNLSMSLRMLPVKPLVQKLQRVIRDTARTLNKQVNFKIVGEQIDIDKSVLDRLADPLIHILRNAVDHGLESTEDRVNGGKSGEGSVTLSFLNEGNHLLVEVRDDGKGINGEVLRRKAVEKGLIAENHPMTEKQLINLIFHPGFSTKSETSEISGRGVGMDVVKTNIEKIGGQVDVTTTVGKGSIFRLQIPLSLAVVDGLVVESETHRFVVPLSQVQETINLRSQQIFHDRVGVGSCFELRGTVVPIVTLDESVNAKRTTGPVDGIALVIEIEDRPIALAVKDILHAQQIVIKPLSNGISAQKGWIGTCVLGDGLPTLILSPVDLLAGKFTHKIKEESIQGVA